MANDRYSSFLQMMGLLQGAYATAGQLKNQADATAVSRFNAETNRYQAEQQARQFDANADYTKEGRDWIRGLTGEARDRTEQELLVDTEVAKNPSRFGKGWRRGANGKLEPYAYELSADEKKRFQNQGGGVSGIQDPVVASHVLPNGDIVNVHASGKQDVTKSIEKQQKYSIPSINPMALSWFASPYRGLQTGNEPVFDTTGGTQVNLKTGTITEVVGKDELKSFKYPSSVNIQGNYSPYALWMNIMARKDMPVEVFNQQPASAESTRYWWEKE